MRPGARAVCEGEVWHLRTAPSRHEFRYRVSQVWTDPDRLDEFCRTSPWWSAQRRFRPVRLIRNDYGVARSGSLSEEVRDELATVLGYRPAGPVRMLTQARRWGWLFNPITIFVAWGADEASPVGAVLEVTNTPWKERHRYKLALEPAADGDGMRWRSTFDKVLHVSPFLDEDHRYELSLREVDSELRIEIKLFGPGSATAVIETELCVERRPATRRALRRAVSHNLLATHRVSLGIHVQAARLWLKRVPYVPHSPTSVPKATP